MRFLSLRVPNAAQGPLLAARFAGPNSKLYHKSFVISLYHDCIMPSLYFKEKNIFHVIFVHLILHMRQLGMPRSWFSLSRRLFINITHSNHLTHKDRIDNTKYVFITRFETHAALNQCYKRSFNALIQNTNLCNTRPPKQKNFSVYTRREVSVIDYCMNN